jgi:hypothetical protein
MRTFDHKDCYSDFTLVESIKGTWSRKQGKTDEKRSDTRKTSFANQLLPNVPNPFNPYTKIKFSVASLSEVTLSVVNVMGKRVKIIMEDRKEPGEYTVFWDGTDEWGQPVTAGIYICYLEARPISENALQPFTASRKLILAK